MILTYQFRIKDSACRKRLSRMASAVNFVWNYCNEASYEQLKKYGKWLSYYDLAKLTEGVGKELNINSQIIQKICKEYSVKRYQFKKAKLNWRSFKRSLGWIPCTNQNIKLEDDTFKLSGKKYKFWKSRDIDGEVKSVSINQNSQGKWFINIQCEIETKPLTNNILEIGVDLGLKAQATLSDGRKYERKNLTKQYEVKLAKAQKYHKKRLVTSIHSKIQNKRKDFNHKLANAILADAKLVIIGDVSSSKLIKTNLAKSVLDAGWSQLRAILEYKANQLGIALKSVNESWTTRTCSVCSVRSGTKGLSGLSVREWRCPCGAKHDRDVNAAINILRIGHDTLTKGIPSL